MKRSPSLTQGFTRTLNPNSKRFHSGYNPTAVESIRKKPSLGPQNGNWLKRVSFIGLFTSGGRKVNQSTWDEPRLPDSTAYGGDGLAHIRSVSTARRALRVA